MNFRAVFFQNKAEGGGGLHTTRMVALEMSLRLIFVSEWPIEGSLKQNCLNAFLLFVFCIFSFCSSGCTCLYLKIIFLLTISVDLLKPGTSENNKCTSSLACVGGCGGFAGKHAKFVHGKHAGPRLVPARLTPI